MKLLKPIKGLLRPAKPDKYYDPVQLKRGIKIEMEHTRSKAAAKRIAKHHIDEFWNYYDNKIGLPAMERKLKNMNKKKKTFKEMAIEQGYYKEKKK